MPAALKITVLNGLPSGTNYQVNFTMRDSITAIRTGDLGYSQDSIIDIKSGVLQQTTDVPIPAATGTLLKAIVYVWNDTADGRAEVTFGAGTPNAVISVYRNQAIAKTSLSIRQGNLVISNVKFNAGQVRIFDILGRVVYSGEFQTRSGNLSINLNGKNISPGRYLLQMRSGANEVTMPFMHMSR
jgi:hypothetical protein